METHMANSKKLKIAVIGAGASGIMSVIKLRAIGQTDVQVFEKAADIGGTWRDNRYPGIACDVPSHLYRFSFAPNPDWTRVCASGAEILDYLQRVYAEFDIAPHVTFNTEVTEMDYRDGAWTLSTSTGTYGPFDALITAMGILRYPTMPNIVGLERFDGEAFHTARWRDDVELAGKRVGIIGTGSTATQIVSAIVDKVGKLSLFQRTPQWIMPLPNTEIPPEERERLRSDSALLEQRYADLGHEFNSKFAAAVVGRNPRVYEHMEQLCRENLESSVADPVLREKLRPNYKVGCKRLVMSDTFYSAITHPNADLVTDKIECIEPKGVRTVDGKLHELDVLVLATGYDAHSTLFPMKVTGRRGLTIDVAWKEANEAYLGVTIPGFPNFFMIGGPNSPIGNFSFLMTAERQCEYAVAMIEFLATSDVTAVAPKLDAMREFNDAVKTQMRETVWSSGCKSWYMDRNGNIASWPWTYEHFEQVMRRPDLTHFELLDAADA
jgi:cation diffusion facilitator CzcD-associated flavoprotein CzcO